MPSRAARTPAQPGQRMRTASPARYGRRTAVTALVVIGSLPMLGLCSQRSATAGPHEVSGEYDVHGVYAQAGQPHPASGSACQAATVGYPDIHTGTPVVVRDGSGGVVATTTLGSGVLHVSGALRDDCAYPFSVSVPDVAAYAIEVGNRGSVAFSKPDLERAGWKATLKIGNYSLGT